MDIVLADREAEIMEVLWDFGPSTVSEVKERVPDELAGIHWWNALPRRERERRLQALGPPANVADCWAAFKKEQDNQISADAR